MLGDVSQDVWEVWEQFGQSAGLVWLQVGPNGAIAVIDWWKLVYFRYCIFGCSSNWQPWVVLWYWVVEPIDIQLGIGDDKGHNGRRPARQDADFDAVEIIDVTAWGANNIIQPEWGQLYHWLIMTCEVNYFDICSCIVPMYDPLIQYE